MKSRRKLNEQAQTDPKAAEKLQARRNRINAWTKNHKDELIEQAKTDPEAAAKLADIRRRHVQATLRCKAKRQQKAV